MAIFGDGGDLQLSHDGTSSYITNSTGNLFINNNNDDGDIIFKSDDGSGGTTAYLTLDGSATELVASKNLRFDQSPSYIFFNGNNTFVGELSNSNKLQLRGGGSNMAATVYIDSSGNMGLGTSAPSSKLDVRGTVQVGVDDTGYDVTFYGDTSGRSMLWDASADRLKLTDNTTFYLGTGLDLGFFHNGTNSEIVNNTGDLTIKNQANDKDIIFQCDDSSGGVEEYFRLDGSAGLGGVSANPVTIWPDNSGIAIGTGQDLLLYHDSSNTWVMNQGAGHFYIVQHVDDKDIVFQCDDGSGGITPYITLDGSAAVTTIHKNLIFDDSVNAVFGPGYDLNIRHTGTISQIQNDNGDLYINQRADDKDIIFQCDDGSGGLTTYFFLDGSVGHVTFPDNQKLYLGSGHDAYLEHDGSGTYLVNQTGHLNIRNFADDSDIALQSDDGSGGLTDYIRVDGSATRTKFAKPTQHADSIYSYFGDGDDLRIYHDGSNSHIANHTGEFRIESWADDLQIINYADDKDIIFKSDDGSGGVATYFKLDGSRAGSDYYYTTFPDKSVLEFGTGNDMQIWHDGSHSQIKNVTGNLTIRVDTDDGDIKFESDDGSGGVTEYFRVDGGQKRTIFSENARFDDTVNASFGTGNDLKIYHNGSASYIDAANSNLYIRQEHDDADIIFQCDDGSGGNATYFFLDGSQTRTQFDKDIMLIGGASYIKVDNSAGRMDFADNVLARFGTSGDLRIQHDSNNSYISQEGTGDLFIRNTTDDKDILLQTDNGSGGVTSYIQLDGGDLSTKILTQKLIISNLPTSDPGVSGQVWNNNGVLNISAGG